MNPATPAWPYPYWIAHRGAGKLAPENTLAAFRLGASFGYRAFECDVKLSRDEIPFLMHDAELRRTTGAAGLGGDRDWGELSRLDAGSWHADKAYAGEPLPTLDAIARHVRANGLHLNIEIKPTPGTDLRTGQVVAEHVLRLWDGAATPPLFSSFRPEALQGAMQAAPQLPRALLLDEPWAGWPEAARRLGVVAVVRNHRRLDAAFAAQARNAAPRLLVYTVNEPADVARVQALQVDGIITDAVDRFDPASSPPGR